VIRSPGAPDVLAIDERPVPEPGPGEIRVRVRASALNRADLLQRRGAYPPPPGYPADIPGLEYAGEVDAVGEGAGLWDIGSRVMGIVGGGAHAEYVCVHEREAIRIPAALDWAQAAAIPEAFITAYDALFRQLDMQAGEHVLIHAVGSGVGTAALQLAKASGAIVLGTSRTPEKLERARELGLDVAIDAEDDWPELVETTTGGHGVPVILDLVGGHYHLANLRVASELGRIAVVGLVSGPRVETDLGLLLRKRLRLIGTVLRTRPLDEKISLARDFSAEVVPLLSSGAVRPVVDSIHPFEAIADAHRLMESNTSFGKIVLLW
jgi:NADPH2:quinone reductase